jgi:imidazolonepropionase
MEKLIGPFKQLITMRNLALKGALRDEELEIIDHAGLFVVDDKVKEVGVFESLKVKYPQVFIEEISFDAVCVPGYIDCHTHICFAGDRANDFALRNAGSSYLEIAEAGGGIWSTVKHTRDCKDEDLAQLTLKRANLLKQQGITTVEVKSGYGLNVAEEIKMLRVIKSTAEKVKIDLVATCLAAHVVPKDFDGSAVEYLDVLAKELFPLIKAENLSNRIDAFVEKSAFTVDQIRPYFLKAKEMGFDITLHADQFSTSGSKLAVELQALSADHLEASTDKEIQLLAKSNVVAVALPAASLGIGCAFTPARKLLNAGASLAIATDWNPGSAPMGNLIASASILATAEKLSNAETWAAVTFRAAAALGLKDRGRLIEGMLADFVIYATDNYQNITYMQGSLQPVSVWKRGVDIFNRNSNYEFV